MLEYEIIEAAADQFRSAHGVAGVPVDVERAVEQGLGLDIVPLPRLQQDFGVDGFLSGDFSAIYVDDRYMSGWQARYRFTLAHEVGHLVLHREFYLQHRISSIGEYEEFLRTMSVFDLESFEGDANNFAGCLLMPKREIEIEFGNAARLASQHGARSDSKSFGAYVAQPLSKKFEVSPVAVEIRLARLRLTS